MSLGSWFRRRSRAAARPAARKGYPQQELLARAAEYNRNAELYWREAIRDSSSRERVLRRPFGATDGADVLYRVGLVFQELHAGPGHVVLDFGAGSCWLSAFLARRGCETISVDVSGTALELGRELFDLEHVRNPWFEPRFESYDGRHLPLDDRSVDRIVCFDAFHHLPNQAETLGEFQRVLRDDGRVVLAEPGEGHVHSVLADHEAERFGVLENELDLPELIRLATSCGFGGFRVKPYPSPAALDLTPREYMDVLDGDWAAFPMEALRASLRQFHILCFDKGSFAPDSRAPRTLRCDIDVIDGSRLRGPAGSLQQARIRLRNTGDTVWLHRETPYGGFVQVGGHLYDPAGRLIGHDYLHRHPLPHDVRPQEVVSMVLDVRLPDSVGESALRLDLVDDAIVWFSQAGASTRELLVTTSSAGERDGPGGYVASITASEPSTIEISALPGTRVTVPLSARNIGRLPWPHTAELRGSFALGGRILDVGGAPCADVDRAVLTESVPPGGQVPLSARLQAPMVPGTYTIKLDLVREGFYWFERVGSDALELPLRVVDGIPDSVAPGLLSAHIQVLGAPADIVEPGAQLTVPLRIRNLGNTLWRRDSSSGIGAVTVAAHLHSASGALLAWDHVHQRLNRDVEPGAVIDVPLDLCAPEVEGDFVFEIDLVDEGIAWFGARGSETRRLTTSVRRGR